MFLVAKQSPRHFPVVGFSLRRYLIPDAPKKIRELVRDLAAAGWQLETGGKGSHRKFRHPLATRKIILSGTDGADAKRYQEKDVQRAIREISKTP